jgi:hypothetical protein
METISRFSLEKSVNETLTVYADSKESPIKEVLSSPPLLTGFFYKYVLKNSAFDSFLGLFPTKDQRLKLEISDQQLHRCLKEIPLLQAVGAIAAIECVYGNSSFTETFRLMLADVVIWHTHGSVANENYNKDRDALDNYLIGVRTLDLDLCGQLFYERTYRDNRFMAPSKFPGHGLISVQLMKLGSSPMFDTFYRGVCNMSYDEIKAHSNWNSIKPDNKSLVLEP